MNPDSPKPLREELEAKLTALLLGELSVDDAELLRKFIAHDPELAALYKQLELTIGLVRETGADPVEITAETSAPLRLSDERREKLLAHFKTVAPKEFARPRRRVSASMVALAAVAASVVIIGLVAILGSSESRAFRSGL